MEKEKKELFCLGAEAVSWGLIDSGVKGVFAYPGTPSTEVFEGVENIIKSQKIPEGQVSQWAANEKVAYEIALGVCYTGQRAAVTMKHVGLNVAMDPFVNSVISGIHGGLVVVVADDPSMHSSQNEQDSRLLATFAMAPCLEPSTIQEAYDFTLSAMELSEKFKIPVLLRLVTRLSHSRGVLERQRQKKISNLGVPLGVDKNRWALIPSIARQNYRQLRDQWPKIVKDTQSLNLMHKSTNSTGVILSGMGRAYFHQLMREVPTVKDFQRLEILSYPWDETVLDKFVQGLEKIIIFEENFPYIEQKVRDLLHQQKAVINIHGRQDGKLPFDGELTPKSLRQALGLELPEAKEHVPLSVPNRPPRLCEGCGHQDAYKAINEALRANGVKDPRIYGDIGCYTLGALPPLDSVSTCVEMGASIGMAYGAALAGATPAVGVIGDSTFFHSGITGLLALARSQVNVNIIIMDNGITAMTGQQPSHPTQNLPDLAQSMGFSPEQIHVMIPLPQKHPENVAKLEKIFSHPGPDLVIFRRECIQALRKGLYKDEEKKNE